MNVTLPNELALLIMILWLALIATTVVVHLAFAVAVFIDATVQRRLRDGLVFVGPFIWSLATLLGGVFITAAYWAIHHSTLRPGAPSPRGAEPTDD